MQMASIVTLDNIYFLTGLVLIIVSVYTVSALFWTLFGLTFMAPIIHLPDTVVGAFLVVMALLSGFKQIRVGSAKESSLEYRTAERDKWGNKLFIPILIFDGIGAGIYSGHNRRHDNVPGRLWQYHAGGTETD